MFSELDNVIFPDSCEVIEIVPSQHYVYPIFKNGSTSLHKTQQVHGWPILTNEEIGVVKTPITVYLRDPKQRFISGVNTFVHFCQRENPNIDTKTVLYFMKNYLWINRHFCPQFFWLINLARYSQSGFDLQGLQAINDIVDINDRAGIDPPSAEFLELLDQNLCWEKLELYFYLDQILIDQIGNCVTLPEIMNNIKHKHSRLYQLVFEKTLKITHVLCKT